MAKAITKKEIQKKQEEKLGKDLGFEEKEFEIISGVLKDDICNYDYELMTGPCTGDVITRKGTNVAHKDLIKAFQRLDVFLAIIDDAFKHTTESDVKKVTLLRKSDITDLYKVIGFKMAGTSEKQTVQLIGSKWVSVGGHIGLNTPKVAVDGEFTFAHELKDCIIVSKSEVELYMGGKKAPVFEQGELMMPDGDEFANAVVK